MTYDRGRAVREALEGQPLVIVDKHGGHKAHPLLIESRQISEQTARLCRLLRIHLEDVDG